MELRLSCTNPSMGVKYRVEDEIKNSAINYLVGCVHTLRNATHETMQPALDLAKGYMLYNCEDANIFLTKSYKTISFHDSSYELYVKI